MPLGEVLFGYCCFLGYVHNTFRCQSADLGGGGNDNTLACRNCREHTVFVNRYLRGVTRRPEYLVFRRDREKCCEKLVLFVLLNGNIFGIYCEGGRCVTV